MARNLNVLCLMLLAKTATAATNDIGDWILEFTIPLWLGLPLLLLLGACCVRFSHVEIGRRRVPVWPVLLFMCLLVLIVMDPDPLRASI